MYWYDSNVQTAMQQAGLNPRICVELDRLYPLVRHTEQHQGRRLESILESEAIAYFVIPLLKALGWNEPYLKIGLYLFDIAGYKNPYQVVYSNGTANWKQTEIHNFSNADLLFEVKAPWATNINADGPSSKVLNQLFGYARRLPHLRFAVATNSIYYFIYERDQILDLPNQPIAKFNLLQKNNDLNRDIRALKCLSFPYCQNWPTP